MSKHPDNHRKALGKGLSALLPTRPPVAQPEKSDSAAQRALQIPINKIDPNPVQPRRVFEPELLQELAQSIRANGIIQPLVVRPHGDRYQLVAGERRLRAAKLADQERVPAIVQDIPDERLLEITLIENIQREDLNPIEVAVAFQRLADELQLNHDDLGKRTGKDRTTVTNTLRLLQLPDEVQQLVAARTLSQGHARCLLALPAGTLMRETAQKCVEQGWTVRHLEKIVQRMTETRIPKRVDEVKMDLDPNVKAAIDEMERVLGTKVRILEKNRQRGHIEIEYYSTDDLDRIYTTIVGNGDGSL